MMGFRTLNYLGSKLRLLDFIEDNVAKMSPHNVGVCDLFAGTGCVSYCLSQTRPVVSCDMQRYSQVICNALLNRYDVADERIAEFMRSVDGEHLRRLSEAFAPLIREEETAIGAKDLATLTETLEHGSVEVFGIERPDTPLAGQLQTVSRRLRSFGLCNAQSLVSRYYGGVYFSYRQAVQLDALLEAIHTKVASDERDLFLAALLSTASDVVDTVGKHFAQPIRARDAKGRIKPLVYSKAVRDKTLDVFALYREWLMKYATLRKTSQEHLTFCGDYADCLASLPEHVRTVYADPPYTREHYSRFYHVLETMVLRDEPSLSTVTAHGETHVSNGIYRTARFQSSFCICSKAPGEFEKMFSLVASSGRNLLLSYSPYDASKKSHPRVVTMEQLVESSQKYFTSVEMISAGSFRHNKLNSTGHCLEAADEAEMLILCKGGR